MNKKVLVIDDSEDDRILMQKYLQKEGCRVVLSETGEDGVEKAQKEKPDIVIVDTMLPGIDGFETCRKIKAIDGLETKVVVITGHIDAVDAAQARKVKVDGYCIKTVDGSRLIDAVKKFV